MMFLPPYTTEFSPIELLFGYMKRALRDVKYKSKEELAKIINKIGFNTSSKVL